MAKKLNCQSIVTEKRDPIGNLTSRKTKVIFHKPETDHVILFLEKLKKNGGKIEKVCFISVDKTAEKSHK